MGNGIEKKIKKLTKVQCVDCGGCMLYISAQFTNRYIICGGIWVLYLNSCNFSSKTSSKRFHPQESRHSEDTEFRCSLCLRHLWSFELEIVILDSLFEERCSSKVGQVTAVWGTPKWSNRPVWTMQRRWGRGRPEY